MARKKLNPHPRKKPHHPFQFVSEITDKHAARFVKSLYLLWTEGGAIDESLSASGIMTWPEYDGLDWATHQTPEQVEYFAAQNAIVAEIEREIRPALKAVFRSAAARVLYGTKAQGTISRRPAGNGRRHGLGDKR